MVNVERKAEPMTAERRQAIFSQDFLSIENVQDLLGLGYQGAAKVVRDIKRATGNRLDISGKIHVQDYIDFFKLPVDRYLVGVSQKEKAE